MKTCETCETILPTHDGEVIPGSVCTCGMHGVGKLANASAIKDAANAKAMGKLVELADRVQAIRRQEETEDYMGSIDFLEDMLKQSYGALKDRVGKNRADEIVTTLFTTP